MAAASAIFIGLPTPALSAILENDPDFQVSWDNTVRLSAIYQPERTALNIANYCTSAAASAGVAAENASCYYGRGFTSGRIDWLSELDVTYRDFGIHASSTAWVDAVDRTGNLQDTSEAYNPASGSYVRAAYDASELGGQQIELYEAFLHGSQGLGDDQSVSFRVGRHVLIWGESLYFSQNGIAAGQAPIDTYQSRMTGPYQSKDFFLPVGQASFSWQNGEGVAVEGYYQFEWRRSRINPEDAYATASDVAGAEENRQIALPIPGFGPYDYVRIRDRAPGAAGQYGLALKWHPGDLDLGLYALRFSAKVPTIEFFADPPTSNVTYRLAYPRDIQIYGASVSAPLGSATIGGELSARRNMPLVNRGVYVPPGNSGSLIPQADTLHVQLSWLYVTPPLPGVPAGANWTGEVAFNHVIGAIANPVWLESGSTRAAAAFRTIFEPQFFQVVPHVDLSVPLEFGFNFLGRSMVVPTMNRGTGDIGIGVTATIDQVWKASIGFTHYFGRTKNSELLFLRPDQGEALSDWDYFSISVQRSF
jgi:hypothetical protein